MQDNVFFVFPQGDFDQNGVVDSSDLAQWQSDFAGGWQSDADWDGDVDGTDFLTWQRQLGSGVAAASLAANVPEPTGMFLLVGAFAAACTGQRFLRYVLDHDGPRKAKGR